MPRRLSSQEGQPTIYLVSSAWLRCIFINDIVFRVGSQYSFLGVNSWKILGTKSHPWFGFCRTSRSSKSDLFRISEFFGTLYPTFFKQFWRASASVPNKRSSSSRPSWLSGTLLKHTKPSANPACCVNFLRASQTVSYKSCLLLLLLQQLLQQRTNHYSSDIVITIAMRGSGRMVPSSPAGRRIGKLGRFVVVTVAALVVYLDSGAHCIAADGRLAHHGVISRSSEWQQVGLCTTI